MYIYTHSITHTFYLHTYTVIHYHTHIHTYTHTIHVYTHNITHLYTHTHIYTHTGWKILLETVQMDRAREDPLTPMLQSMENCWC